MQIGKRIIFNKQTGKVLNNSFDERTDTGLTQDLINELRPAELDFIDLPYGDTTLKNADQFHIDVVTKKIVIDHMVTSQPTYEQLQQQLLQSQGVI